MALRGRMDGVLDGVLRGWIWDPDRPSVPLLGEVHLDGQPLARFRADLPRADLEAIGFGAGGAGFALALPAEAQDGQAHEIALIAEDQWLPITVDRLALVIPPRLHMLRGRIEGAAGGQCRGWVWDEMRPLLPVWLEIRQEGRLLGRQLANRPRPDLREAGIGEGQHGFAINLLALKPRPAPGSLLTLRCTGAEGDQSEPGVTEEGWLLGEVVMPTLPGPRPARLSRRDILQAARKAEGERDLAQAARLLEAGLLDDPSDADLLSVRARVHLAQQEFEPAERLARAALRHSPGHPRALLILARITTALGQHEEAAAFWAGIGPEDTAFPERLARRPRSLLALGRPGEALNELALALKSRPDDAETLRRMAEMAEAADAPRAALAHWRHVLSLSPPHHATGDQLAGERVAALRARLAPSPPELLASPLASPLADPTLREWRGPLEASAGMDPVRPSPGLSLRALGGRVRHGPVAPQQHRPGEFPAYGVRLCAEGGGAELCFALSPATTRPALRMGIEVAPLSAGLTLSLALRPITPDGTPMGERLLRHGRLAPRRQLLRFDLELDEMEARALCTAGMELVVRLPGPGTCDIHPPRPLARLRHPIAPGGGFESKELPFLAPAPAPHQDALTELACPFTSIAIIAPRADLVATIAGVLQGTGAPFECVVSEEAGWPSTLLAQLHQMAARDPRFRLLPPGARAATGWVALIEAPPPGGPGWLAALHARAAEAGRAEAPGVLLEWCAPYPD